MSWVAGLVVLILEKLIPWALTKLMEWNTAREADERTKEEREKSNALKLKQFNDAFNKAMDGQPLTPEQKEELKNAIRNLTRIIEPPSGL